MTAAYEESYDSDVTYIDTDTRVARLHNKDAHVGSTALADIIVFPSPEAYTLPQSDVMVFDQKIAMSQYGSQLQEYMNIRNDFVNAMGWRTQSHDDDRYDTDPETKYFLKADEAAISDELICGMRLTKTASFKDSLSWSMLDGRPELKAELTNTYQQLFTTLEEKAKQGELWDLTRLVTPVTGTADVVKTAEGVHELIGAAIAETAGMTDAVNQSPLWFFLVGDGFERFLSSSGIKHDILYSGILTEGDAVLSHLCVTDPLDAYDFVRNSGKKRHEQTYRAVTRGIDKATATHTQLD